MSRKKRDAALTEDERLDLCQKVQDLRDRGWTMTQVARAVGYANASALYSACTFSRQLPRERYEEICRLHSTGATPTDGSASHAARLRVLPGGSTSGQSPTSTAPDAAAANGATRPQSGPGGKKAVRGSLHARSAAARSSAGRPQSAGSAAPKMVSATVSPAAPPPTWTALDHLMAAADDLGKCSDNLIRAAKLVGTPLTAPGFERFAGRVKTLAQDIRRSVP